MIHCRSKQIGQAGEAMTDHSGKSCKPNEEYTSKWTKEQMGQFIKLRGENHHLFTGAKNSASVAWRTILEKMGQQGKVTPLQAKTKDCKYPGSGEGVSEKPTAATWPWFVLMDEVLGQRSSTTPPVLIASIPEETPGPSRAVGNQMEKEDSEPAGRGQKRKRDRDEEMMELIREDMRAQRMDRPFSILERMAPK
ncbi:hypothetical protein AMECASPLE_037320 [Ameca splendens]|uniref:Uncharacterized protein n=1 Tax=Ameca splendens TaxID=208324 RepID=A0ABV1AEY8_9TELE